MSEIFIMKFNLFLLLFFMPVLCFSQNERDLVIDDGWAKYKRCIEKNTIQPIAEIDKIESKLTSFKNEDSLLLFIEKNYREEIRNMLRDSIEDAALNLPEILKKYASEVEISIKLSDIFIKAFLEKYSVFSGLEKCARNKNDLPVFDYFTLFAETDQLIGAFLRSKNHTCNNYPTFAYLFKMAVIRYKPELSKYVSRDILNGWEAVLVTTSTKT